MMKQAIKKKSWRSSRRKRKSFFLKCRDEADGIIAEAKEAADGIIKGAQEKAKEAEKPAKAKMSRAEQKLEEYVEVKLFKDGRDYNDDVFVSLNGETVQIKRGVPVKIKRKFANILDASQAQDLKTQALIDGESDKFKKESADRGF